MDFQWSPRATPYTVASDGTLSLENERASTLRYENTTFTLISAQLCTAGHTRWLINPDDQSRNREDFIAIFEASATQSLYKYIAFVIPIARVDTGGANNLLSAMLTPENSVGPYFLSELFPVAKNTLFAGYSTCLAGAGATSSIANMDVYVSTAALPVAGATLTSLATKARFTSGANYPPAKIPFGYRVTPPTLSINANFADFIITTDTLLDFEKASRMLATASTAGRTDSADAYKCVPLDPDRDVVDGSIMVDTVKGTLLSNLLKDRTELRTESVGTAKEPTIGPGRIEKYLGSALGWTLVILLILGIIYVIALAVGGGSSVPGASGAAAAGPSILATIPFWIILLVVGGFSGFILGLSLV